LCASRSVFSLVTRWVKVRTIAQTCTFRSMFNAVVDESTEPVVQGGLMH